MCLQVYWAFLLLSPIFHLSYPMNFLFPNYPINTRNRVIIFKTYFFNFFLVKFSICLLVFTTFSLHCKLFENKSFFKFLVDLNYLNLCMCVDCFFSGLWYLVSCLFSDILLYGGHRWYIRQSSLPLKILTFFWQVHKLLANYHELIEVFF